MLALRRHGPFHAMDQKLRKQVQQRKDCVDAFHVSLHIDDGNCPIASVAKPVAAHDALLGG